jgi:hypothetical protein
MFEFCMPGTSGLRTLMSVALGPGHLRPGRTRHTIGDAKGRRDFPPFVKLEIAQYPGHLECYLFHICEDGMTADTWHKTVEEALDQAEWEFNVRRNEWKVTVNETSTEAD